MSDLTQYRSKTNAGTISSAANRKGSHAKKLLDNRELTSTPELFKNQHVIQGKWWHSAALGLGTALTGGLLGLGYLGYRYYRHRQRENTLNDIRNEQAGQPVTTHIMHGAAMDDFSHARTDDVDVPQGARNYDVHLNPNNPVGLGRTDASLMRIANIHERTHVSADMSYSANAGRSNMFLDHGDPTQVNFGQTQYQNNLRMGNRTITLEHIVQHDPALTPGQRAEMLERVEYSGRPNEYDPVINELLAYTKEYGIRANSWTVKALVKLARENLARRTPGGGNLQGNWPR